MSKGPATGNTLTVEPDVKPVVRTNAQSVYSYPASEARLRGTKILVIHTKDVIGYGIAAPLPRDSINIKITMDTMMWFNK